MKRVGDGISNSLQIVRKVNNDLTWKYAQFPFVKLRSLILSSGRDIERSNLPSWQQEYPSSKVGQQG